MSVLAQTAAATSNGPPARLLAAVTKEQLTDAPNFTIRDTVEAKEAAEEAQLQMQQQPQQMQQPAPSAATAQ